MASYSCFFTNPSGPFALGWWWTPHLGGSRTARGGVHDKSAHAPIGCRAVTQPRVTVVTSFCEQGRSSFVHFSGPQEHKRTTSAPSAPIPLVEVQGGCICKDTQAKHGVSTEGRDKRERSEKDWPSRSLTGLARSGEHSRHFSIGRGDQVSIKCGSARKPTELTAKHTAGLCQPVAFSSSFCSSRVWRSLIHTLKALYSATHVARHGFHHPNPLQ